MKKFIFPFILFLALPAFSFAASYEDIAQKLIAAAPELSGSRLVILPFKTDPSLPPDLGINIARKIEAALLEAKHYKICNQAEVAEAMDWLSKNGDPKQNAALQLMKRLEANLAISAEVFIEEGKSLKLSLKLREISSRKLLASLLEPLEENLAKAQKLSSLNDLNIKASSPASNASSTSSASGALGASRASSASGASGASSASRLYKVETFSDFPPSKSDFSDKASSYDYVFFDISYPLVNNLKLDIEREFGNNISGLEPNTLGPISLRIGAFLGAIGFDLSLRYAQYKFEDLNYFYSAGLKTEEFKLSIYEIGADLFFRLYTSSFLDLYAGLGVGVSLLNDISYEDEAEDDLSVGASFRLPLGIRYKIHNLHFIAEAAYEASSREDSYYNKLKLSGFQFSAGIGLAF